MEQHEKNMEIIALLSYHDDNYIYFEWDSEVVEHLCEKTNEQKQLQLIDVEYFKEGQIRQDKANFCEDCNQVFIYKPGG